MRVRIDTKDLTMGMYVSELDRPWLDSPFLFQGFLVDSQSVMKQVQQTCEYVYVDDEESVVPLAHGKHDSQTIGTGKKLSNESQKLSPAARKAVTDYKNFKTNLAHARNVNLNTKTYISSILKEARLGSAIDVKKAKVVVNNIVECIINNPHALIWFTNLKDKNEYTANHSLNVCIISLAFGSFCQLDREQLNILGFGALFHDIGKMKVPLSILDKPGELSADEFEEIKRHPRYGHDLLESDQDFPRQALDIVLSHHERNDGTGYPRGIKSDKMEFLAKLVSIVDMYDAITTSRVYHEPITPHEALSRMFHFVPDRFDQKLVEQFIKCLGIYPVGSVVELNSGDIGVVVSINDHHHLKPVILLVTNNKGEYYDVRKLINLASPELEHLDHPPEIKRVINTELEGFDLSRIIIDESLPIPRI
ncbi:MAG: HD-GYP domain-containing protein [Gammaproteobacteria bacterium]|jgi:HD-GYP domain-containing protein (c-di-GMP phosphodiesterase class II)